MKGHYSIDYEYDYILWLRTNSTLSNETYLTIKLQILKKMYYYKNWPANIASPLWKWGFIIVSLFGGDVYVRQI